MRKIIALATLAALTAIAVPGTSYAASKASCKVDVSTNLLRGKSEAIIYPRNNARIHRVVFIFPTMPTQDVTKVRDRSTVFSSEAPVTVVAFRNGNICQVRSMVGVG